MQSPRLTAVAYLFVASLPLGVATKAQQNTDFLPRSSPQPAFHSPEPAKYNLKFGKVKARLYGSVQAEYNDNINISKDAESDFSIGPNVRVGFVWPINKDHLMQFNLSLGYRYYLNHSSLSTVTIDNSSRIDHKIVIEEVQINIYDSFALQTDPSSRPELSGSGANLFNFRRFHNTLGVLASWQALEDLNLALGYEWSKDFSLNNEFSALDHDEHTFTAASYYTLSPRWTVGMLGSYSFWYYDQKIQNDGHSYSVGPIATYKPSQFILMDAQVAYTESFFDASGTVADTSGFSGITFSGSVRHTMNSRMNQSFRVARSQSLGVGSNFTEMLTLQYGVNARLASNHSIYGTLGYEKFKTSGALSEEADRYIVSVGSLFQLTARWNFGLSYSLAWKESELADRDYVQNRVTLDVNRSF